MRTTDRPFPMETTYTWRQRDQGTLMTLRNCGQPNGFSRLVAPFLSTATRRANRKDLALVKRLLENA